MDEDYGQLENLRNEQEDMYPLTFPAVLIEALYRGLPITPKGRPLTVVRSLPFLIYLPLQ